MTGTVNPTLPGKGDPRGTADARVKGSLITLRDALNAVLNEANEVPRLGKWYTPKVIAAEESRTNTAYGTLTTPDEVTGVVLPENGLILVGYAALLKSSVEAAGRAAIFLGSNQLKKDGATIPEVQEAATIGTSAFINLHSSPIGLSAVGSAGYVTTGQSLSTSSGLGGLCCIFAGAGTYAVSIKFKASSGSVTAKERKLWVAVLG